MKAGCIMSEKGRGGATLFPNPKPKSEKKPKPLPAAAVNELINKCGIPAHVVRKLPPRAAWAKLWAFRRASQGLSDEQRREVEGELSRRLRDLTANDDWTTEELHDLIGESLAALDRGPLCRVAGGLANLLEELSKAA